MMFGLGVVGVAAVTVLASNLTGVKSPAEALAQMATIGLTGVGVFAMGALPLPRWARLRKRQMDGLAERLLAAVARRPIADRKRVSVVHNCWSKEHR
jgi:hypothetical protein